MNDLDYLKQIEKILCFKFNCVFFDKLETNKKLHSYSIDLKQNITGIALENSALWLLPLSVFSNFKHLKKLKLKCSILTNISFLKKLKNLTYLDLSENNLTDISHLKDLKNLTYLDLSENNLTDISHLKDLKNLSYLDLSENNLTDISHLKDLKNFSYLDLSINKLTDISHLKDLKNLSNLDLSSNQLTDISVLKELKNLSSLYLSSNQLTDISVLKELKNLSSLDLSHNQLTDIAVLKELKNLSSLYLSYNQLTNISVLKELKNLSNLDLSYNNLTDISHLKDLKNLSTLELSSNNLTDISHLKDLKKLSSLNLINNKLTDISHLKELKNLSYLNLSNNNLTDISCLKELNNLSYLNLNDNKLTNISHLKHLKNLSTLELSDNKLSDISVLKELKSLISLDLNNNPIKEPDKDIITQCPTRTKKYFEDIEKDKEEIYEAKILILGERGAGKTTLFKKLQKPTLKLPSTKSTLGIDVIKNRKFSHPTKKDTQITTTIWDFGGHTIQYHLHKYSITRDALYIIVADYRRADTDWDYWFNTISLLTRNKAQDNLPKVLVVLNLNKSYDENANFSGIEKSIEKFNERLLDIEKIDIDFSVNNYKWDFLQEKIKEKLAKLPIIPKTFPKIWQYKKLKENLEKEKKNYISKSEFYALCPEGLDKEEDRLEALDYFNRTGNLIHFPDDLALSNVIFLQPNWITKALYASLNSGNENMKKGFFEKKWIFDFWQKQTEEKYQEPDCNYLLNLMLKDKLNIAYEVEKEKYIVPMLLPFDPPDKYNWNYKSNISIKIEYGFIPSPIILDLIVRIHNMIDNKWVWSEGVILKDQDSDATALIVQENKNLLKINIANGNLEDKKNLLHTIQKEITTIHKKLYGLEIDYKELVKCNCGQCQDSEKPHYFDIKTIKHFIKNLNKQDIQCFKSGEQISIRNLIGITYKKKSIIKKLGIT